MTAPGLVLFAIALQAVRAPIAPGEAIVTFAGTVAISVAIGLATGFVATRIMALVDDHLVELTITVVLAYGSYIARGPGPPVRGDRDRDRRDRARQPRPRGDDVGDRYRIRSTRSGSSSPTC